MNGAEKSDLPTVPTKPTNKAGRPAAEPGEGSGGIDRNVALQSTLRTQSRDAVSQAQDRIRAAVTRNKREKLTALLHHVDVDALRWAFFSLKKQAAPGVDGATWEHYAADLDRNLIDLHARVQRGAYRALPSRRQYIPKADGKQRPLGIAAIEDKIFQAAVVAIPTPIGEAEFLGFSYRAAFSCIISYHYLIVSPRISHPNNVLAGQYSWVSLLRRPDEYPYTICAGHEAALRKIRPSGRIIRMSLKQRGRAMRQFDFAPFSRSTVGFDRLFSMLDQVDDVEGTVPNYPPYNIERSGENAYSISVAVAGFAETDLSLEVKENTLAIRGKKQTGGEEKRGDVLYQGIAGRNFERNFQLADHVQVKGASLENGLLHVDLVRVVPEAMKPRAIPIKTAGKVGTKNLEGTAAKIAA
jgi:HSP20 family molecular chaperone IbpA